MGEDDDRMPARAGGPADLASHHQRIRPIPHPLDDDRGILKGDARIDPIRAGVRLRAGAAGDGQEEERYRATARASGHPILAR
jgi:hypothetical protein